MRGVAACLVVVIGLMVVACSSAAPAASTAPTAAAPGPAGGAPPAAKPAASVPDWVTDPAVYEAAKKEGTVVFYSTLPQALAEAIGKKFSDITGIKAEVTRVGSGATVDRVERELQGGLKVTDVVEQGMMAAFIDWKKRGILEPYRPKTASNVDTRHLDPDKAFNAFYVNMQFIAYNPKFITAAEAPKSWKDLYDVKWKGKMSLAHPKYSSVMVDWVFWQNKLFGPDYLKKLQAVEPMIFKTAVEGLPSLISGERPLQGSSYSDSAWEAKLKGQPIEFVYPEEGVTVANDYTGILKAAPHPNAAKVFVDYLFSTVNGQDLADQNIYTTIPGVKYKDPDFKPLTQLKTLVSDPAEESAQVDKLRDDFSDVFGG